MGEVSCGGCGDCCRVIPITVSYDEQKTWQSNPPKDARWIREDLYPISDEEARRRLPYFRPDMIGTKQGNKQYLYGCKNFNDKTNKCALHGTAEKPACCEGYPLYGKSRLPDYSLAFLPKCTFHELKQSAFLQGLA